MNNLVKIFLVVCFGLFSMSAGASGHHKDHELARQALINGDVLSLQQVLDKVSKTQQGTPIKIDFDHAGGDYFYKIKLLRKDGGMAKLKVDATNGEILKIKERSRK